MAKQKEPRSDGQFSLVRETDVLAELDPKLQEVILAYREGRVTDRQVVYQADDGTMKVDVLAQVKDSKVPIPGLEVGRIIGDVITGTVAVQQIEAVRQHPNVVSLKRARRLHGTLQQSVRDIEATPDQVRAARPDLPSNIDGHGVIIGIVDFGHDFAHRNLRNPDGTTRLLYLWDQTGPHTTISPKEPGLDYGREFTRERINRALAAIPQGASTSRAAYDALGYGPQPGAHGTHVSDIAAGNGSSTGAPGVAPKADIIFVHLAGDDTSDEESFGNSTELLEAVDYIFTKAAQLGRSAVINLSLGTHGGPHDGSTPVERGFDHLLQQSGRAIVISAGNSWAQAGHAKGTIAPGQSRSLTWRIPDQDETPNELEVWYPSGGTAEVTLVTPSGQRLGPVAPSEVFSITSGGTTIGRIIHRSQDPTNGARQIDILLTGVHPGGDWHVELKAAAGTIVDFHAWIERDAPGFQSRLGSTDEDKTFTLGSISCGAETIVVGSYNSRDPGKLMSGFSSEGPTRDGRQKPEVCAPGDGILAANATTQSSLRMSGTSMAAPHVTGLIALLMQAAGRPLTTTEIRRAVLGSARGTPGHAWDSRAGQGRVTAVGALGAAVPAPSMALPDGSTSNGSESDKDLSSLVNVIQAIARASNESRSRVRFEFEVIPFRAEAPQQQS